MLERFRRTDGTHHDHEGSGATAVRDRPAQRGAVDRGPTMEDRVRDARARQHDEFGGINWGAAFFGWLVAVGMAAILASIVAAAGAAIGFTTDPSAADAETIGLAGGIALLVVMLLAYYAGGYVAGRMSRFDGARQGAGSWLVGLLVTIVLAVAAVVLGSEYNVLSQLNLPTLPVGEAELTTGGLIALVAIVLGTLLAAVAGGISGQRYHRRVDRVGIDH